MFPWSIPSVAIPASIQSRFLSFALKRSIGHLVKPGQLDPEQIEAQIGSGFVEVKDIQLDEEAINALLADSPVRLVSGTLGTVTARVPWPNILSAAFALSIGGVRLKFAPAPPSRKQKHARNVTESVVLAAEEFVHEELTQEENNELRKSIILEHPREATADDGSYNPPGSLDPWLKDKELEEVQDVDAAIEGVSVLASVVERILARFTFNAKDIAVSIVQPDVAELVLSLDTLSFGANGAQDPERADDSRTHTLRVSGISVAVHDLSPKPIRLERSVYSVSSSTSRHTLAASVASTARDDAVALALATSPPADDASALGLTYEPAPAPLDESPFYDGDDDPPTPTRLSHTSPLYDSDNDMDDALMMAMSQSIATLPEPRPRSNSQSTASGVSVYHSVQGSGAGTVDDDDDDSDGDNDVFHDTQDTSSRFVTDSQFLAPQSSSPPPRTESRRYEGMPGSMGTSSIMAPRPFSPVSVASPPPPPPAPVPAPVPPTAAPVEIPTPAPAPPLPVPQGHIILSMGNDAIVATVTSSRATGMSYFALDVRLGVIATAVGATQVRNLNRLIASLPQQSPQQGRAGKPTAGKNPTPTLDFHVQVRGIVVMVLLDPGADIPLNAFYAHPLSAVPAGAHLRVHIDGLIGGMRIGDAPLHASVRSLSPPASKFSLTDLSVFVHDGHRGYSPLLITDAHLGTQYTSASTFPSFDVVDWTNMAHEHPRLSPWRTRVPQTAARAAAPPAAVATLKDNGKTVALDVLPLRVFVDLRVVEKVLAFATSLGLSEQKKVVVDDEDEETPPATPRASDTRRLLDDLDDRQAPPSEASATVRCPCIRIEVRVPTARSGAMVVDIHDIVIGTGSAAKERPQGVTFARDMASAANSKFKIIALVKWNRVLLTYAGVGDNRATSFASLQGSPSSTLTIRPTSLDIALPTLHGLLSKTVLDGLQTWADDLTQWAERAFASPPPSATSSYAGSDVLGSRYFEHRPESLASSSSASGSIPKGKSGMLVRLVLLEANLQMFVPRAAADGEVRPLLVSLAELDLLLEPKPEGRNETLITLSLMGVAVSDTSVTGEAVRILGLTHERNYNSHSNPMIKLRFASSTDPVTRAKEARVRLNLYGFTFVLGSDFSWATDLGLFVKNPPGTFEVVVPTERTRITVKIVDGSVQVVTAGHAGAIALALTEMELGTELLGDSPDVALQTSVGELTVLAVDDMEADVPDELREEGVHQSSQDTWRGRGYAVLAEVSDLSCQIVKQRVSPKLAVDVQGVKLSLYACADTFVAIGGFAAAFGRAVSPPDETAEAEPAPRTTAVHSFHRRAKRGDDIMASVDDNAFRRLPAVGSAPDLVDDDLPTNMDYVGLSYGAAGGLVALSEDGDSDEEGSYVVRQPPPSNTPGVVSEYGGETIRMLVPDGLHIIDDYFDNLPPDADDATPGDQEFRLRVSNCDFTVLLHDGYDWAGTRKAIEEEMRRIRRRLEKIRQLLASGQTPDNSVEGTSAVLFNSVHIGLHESPDELDPATLLVAIDEELGDGDDATSVTSWQSMVPAGGEAGSGPSRRRGASGTAQQKRQRRLRRSAKPMIEVRLASIGLDVDKFVPDCSVASRVLCAVRDVEILDHIKTSTWRKFLTSKRADSHGNVRETGSNMARVELTMVRPVPGHPSEEARFKAKVLPLRLHVDQDALDFLKKFGAFRDPRTEAPPPTTQTSSSQETFFQHVEIFPIDLKLDYKPKRVDFQALRDGKTIELMNFFHFDGAEMTLRRITLSGLTGWARLGDTLNDIWTPDVKANQLADVISGVAPIRSIVNVGSGMADLVLLPIAQYKKDKRLVRGMQRGATSFMRSTAMEAIKLGAHLATGTQVILEHAEGMFGGGKTDTRGSIPTLEVASTGDGPPGEDDDLESSGELQSKYATQPENMREGVRGAYKSLRTNLNSAAQTILAVPMEVHESSGDGTLHTVVRAIPIAVLRPMIGASEAVSKTLFGLRNTLDPTVMQENEAKYKRRER